MFYYIITFFLCFFANSCKSGVLSTKPYSKILYRISVVWIFIFLCFGYMTGSDWRDYELQYDGSKDVIRLENKGEVGFIFLMQFFHLFTSDFWIFSGIMKMLYLFSLVVFLNKLTKQVWSVIGISFSFSLLFMMINCPMRFMIALMFIQFSLYFYLSKRYIFAIVLMPFSISFHVTSTIVFFLIILGYLLKRIVSKLNIFFLSILFLLVLMFPLLPGNMDFLYSLTSRLFGGEISNIATSKAYSNYSVDSLYTIGTLKNILLFSLMIFYRKDILKMKYGDLAFSYSILFFLLGVILGCIPTGFRLVVIFSYCAIICMVNISINWRTVLRYSFYSLFLFVMIKDIYLSYPYIPYTNSIPYILTEHLSYSYRFMYNFDAYEKRTGKSIW